MQNKFSEIKKRGHATHPLSHSTSDIVLVLKTEMNQVYIPLNVCFLNQYGSYNRMLCHLDYCITQQAVITILNKMQFIHIIHIFVLS